MPADGMQCISSPLLPRYCFVMRILLKILDVNALAWIVGNSIAGTGDYKKMRKLRDEAKKSS